jgi:PAS domain S-box-containing protein
VSWEAFFVALEGLSVVLSGLDNDGTFRWVNARAREILGQVLGRRFEEIVAPECRHVVRDQFAQATRSRVASNFELFLLDRAGQRVAVAVRSAPLLVDRRVVGVLGAAIDGGWNQDGCRERAQRRPPARLTRRQLEVLYLLDDGRGTTEIAALLNVSHDTVRNHIRALLFRLGAHSRLEAVALARRWGYLK